MTIRSSFAFMLLYMLLLFLAHKWLLQFDDRPKALKMGMAKAEIASVILLGDSHIAYAVKNKYLPDSILAFAYPGESIIAHEVKLRELISQNKMPNKVILQLEPHMFNPRRKGISPLLGYPYVIPLSTQWSAAKNIMLISKQIIYLACPFVLDEVRQLLQSILIRQLLLNQPINQYKSWHYDNHADLVLREPYKEIPATPDTSILFSRSRMLLSMNKTDQQLINHFMDMVSLCQLHEIQLILLEPPVSPLMKFQYLQYEGLNKKIDKLVDEQQLRYLQVAFDSNNNSYFYNYDHLNELGAKEYSKNLIYAIKKDTLYRE